MKNTQLTMTLWAGAMCLASLAQGAPKIQFDQLVYDFGKTSRVETVSGTFKFKNVGDEILKIKTPKPSCGCTVASLKPDTLKPGETGELAFTLNLAQARPQLEKRIDVASNDPKTPEVSLNIKVDYTPIYHLDPLTVSADLAFGRNETEQFATLTRTDGKPLRILRLDPSKTWIKARVEPGAGTDSSTARIRIIIQRDGSPRRLTEFVNIYTTDQTNLPVSTLHIYGQVRGEVSVNPESLYWSVKDAPRNSPKLPEATVLRRVTILAANGKTLKLKNPKSTNPGIQVELVPKESGKVYELVAKLDETPRQTVSGNVSFETSVAAQPTVEIPFIINVSKP